MMEPLRSSNVRSLDSLVLRRDYLNIYWVAVKELKLSYHNGYI